MQLFLILLLLVVPYLILTLAGRWITVLRMTRAARARVGLTLFFLFTGIGHFIFTDEMSQMLPPSIPYRVEIIYLTGILEILGAIGVWIPGLMKLAGVCLIVLLVGVFPTNIYAAMKRLDFGGHGYGPIYLLFRVPFQLLVIWWTYFATGQQWFKKHRYEAQDVKIKRPY